MGPSLANLFLIYNLRNGVKLADSAYFYASFFDTLESWIADESTPLT